MKTACHNIIINCLIKNGELYLDEYGPTQDECTWTDKRNTAFHMAHKSAKTRLAVVQQWWPEAKIVTIK